MARTDLVASASAIDCLGRRDTFDEVHPGERLVVADALGRCKESGKVFCSLRDPGKIHVGSEQPVPVSLGEIMSRRFSTLILLHGFASSFDHNWRQTGWVDILSDFGFTVPTIDLPGHGLSPALTDPAGYADVEEEVRRALPAGGLIAGVGFSAGADLLLRLALGDPEQFDRIVLLGLGDNVFDSSDPAALVAALESNQEPEDIHARLFRRLAQSAGNDPRALSAFLRRPRQPVSDEEMSRIHCPILVVLGRRDPAGPADRLLAALPSASLVVLAGVDHFATPSHFEAIDATLEIPRPLTSFPPTSRGSCLCALVQPSEELRHCSRLGRTLSSTTRSIFHASSGSMPDISGLSTNQPRRPSRVANSTVSSGSRIWY